MAAKAIICICIQVLFIQIAFSKRMHRGLAGPSPFNLQARGRGYGPLAYESFTFPGKHPGPVDFAPISGGTLPVTSASPFSPTGVSLFTEGTFEGTLSVVGEIPFLGTANVQGMVPTGGAGAVNYGCGKSVVGIVSERFKPALGPVSSRLPSKPEFGRRSYLY